VCEVPYKHACIHYKLTAYRELRKCVTLPLRPRQYFFGLVSPELRQLEEVPVSRVYYLRSKHFDKRDADLIEEEVPSARDQLVTRIPAKRR